jgi:hypothetical protein
MWPPIEAHDLVPVLGQLADDLFSELAAAAGDDDPHILQ